MLKRIGVIGDVHCEDVTLAVALDALAEAGVGEVLAVGDFADGTGDLNRCCGLLAGTNAIAVRGNHDRWLFEGKLRDEPGATSLASLEPSTLAFLRALPATRELESVAGRVLLCHGLGADDMAKLKPDDSGYALENNDALGALLRDGRFAFVVNGHTHRRMVRRVGALTVINAGTLHRDDGPGFCIVDFEAERAEFFDVTADGARAAETLGLADWTALF
jgi:predicted phosphodiesterase